MNYHRALFVSLFLLLLAVFPQWSTAQDFYLDPNGVTVRCENATPGDTGTVNGTEYLAVDLDRLQSEYANPNGWDMATVCTSLVTDLSWMFAAEATFNQDISSWDVSNVTDMREMFWDAAAFDQPIGNWDVSNVTTFSKMFQRATNFNQDLSGWCTESADTAYNGSDFAEPSLADEHRPGFWGIGCEAPVASFTAVVTDNGATMDVVFASASSDPDGDDLTYAWVFGDGTSSTEANPSHTYNPADQYTVELTVSDGRQSRSVSQIVSSEPNYSALLPVPTPSYPIGGLTVYTLEPDLSFWLGEAQGSMTFEIDIQVAGTQMSVCNVPARPSGLAAMSFATSACDPALVAGETYRWRVRSTDGADVSAWSDWALFTTNGPGLAVAAVPSYPADSLPIYTTSPTLHWYTEVDNTGIKFEAWYLKRNAGDDDAAPCGDIIDGAAADSVRTTSITNKKITGLEAGATYDWCVRSTGDNGDVDSDVATFTIANGWISNATFALWPTSNQIVYQGNPTLYWSSDVSSDPVTSYEVEYCVDSNGFGQPGCAIEYGLTDNQYQLTGLAGGAQVTWRVRSTHASGIRTDWTNAVSQGAFSVYGVFGEPRATPWYPIDDFMVYGTSVRLTWYVTGAVGVPSYEVQYSSNENFPDNDSTIVATSDQAVLDVSDLNEGWTYYWRVRVSSDGGFSYGFWSAAASFEVSGGAPMPRIGGPNNGVGIASSSPTLSWIVAPATDVVYDIRYATEGGAYTEVTDLAEPYVQVQNLAEGSYTWQVRSRTTDGSFTSPYSASGRFTTMASMSVDTEEERDLPVAYELGQNYPNPFNPQTTIPFALPSSQKVSLVVYDMLGRQLEVLVDGVMSAGNHQAVWNAQHMPSGMYVYRLATPNGIQTRLMQLIK